MAILQEGIARGEFRHDLDAQLGERIHLLVVPRNGAAIDAAGLLEWARAQRERCTPT